MQQKTPVIALALALAAAVAFVVRQLRTEHPLIDLEPVKSSAFWPALILVRHHVILLFPAAAREATRSPQRLLSRDYLIRAIRPASRRAPRRC